jgi:lactate dehydrogenase-like 2-hydroxyacid dehydrogenase
MSTDALRAAMREYDALCPTVTDRIDESVLAVDGRRVQLLGNFGVGYNHIDIEAAKKLGVRVSNTPDVLTETTADLAILLLLMTTRRAGEGERELRDGRWTGWRPTHLMGQSLEGKLLGLIGFGRIAQATARKARQGFGMRIAYNSRRRAATEVEQQTAAQYIDAVDTLVATCDVISLHCPGGASTFHLINAERLRLMKRNAVLINTARGPVVDEAALVAALCEKRIAAAGLDVYEEEPRVHPGLLTLENAVLLPHLGSATLETRTAMGMRVAQNLEAYFAGTPLRDPVV